jgi:proteasome lid subunit RPN8/RPN11
MNDLASGLWVKPEHWSQMETEVRIKAPEEACGIVAGRRNHSELVIPVTNILHSVTSFRMEPKEQLNAFLLVEERRLDILAIYHSHPEGIDKPSFTDFEELTFPGIIYLIWYKIVDRWNCKGYLMRGQMKASEVQVIVK